jgi:hypothetical protein
MFFLHFIGCREFLFLFLFLAFACKLALVEGELGLSMGIWFQEFALALGSLL